MNSKKYLRIFLMLLFFVMIHCVSVNAASAEDIAFDSNFYASVNPDVVAVCGNDASVLRNHYVNYGVKEGRLASVYFDVKYYLYANSDVAASLGATNYEGAYNHFINYGIKEGRASSRIFDVNHYLNVNGDVKSHVNGERIPAFEHYINYGVNEKRNASPVFDLSHYIEINADIKNAYKTDYAKYLEHYVRYGYAEGRNATSHAFGEAVVKGATCTEGGQSERTCAACGYVEVSASAALGHVLAEGATSTVEQEVTCTQEGRVRFTCDRCKQEVVVTTPATGHDMKFKEGEVLATCEDKGIEVWECSICKEKERRDVPALGHHLVEKAGAAKKEATCSEKGYEFLVCDREGCGKEETKEIPATGQHVVSNKDNEIIITKLETCTENGLMNYTCEQCGKLIEDAVRPAKHTYETIAEVPATCTAEGTKTEKCTLCGFENKTTTKKLEHDMKKVNSATTTDGRTLTTAPVYCEKDGLQVMKCAKCGTVESTVLPKTGHKMEQILLTTDPAPDHECGEKVGEVTYTCVNDNCMEDGTKKEEKKTQQLTHKDFVAKIGAEELNADGHTIKTTKCGACDRILSTDLYHVEITKAMVEALKETDKDGNTSYKKELEIDGKVLYKEYKRTHYVKDKVSYVDISYVCKHEGCQYTQTITELAPTDEDHIKGAEAVVITKPTCHTKGTRGYKCTICGIGVGETEEIPEDYALHVFDKNSEVNKAAIEAATITCTEGDDVELICSNPGCSIKAKYTVPANNEVDSTKGLDEGVNVYHTWEENADKKVDATCGHGTITTYECSDCHKTLSIDDENKDNTKHDYAYGYRQFTEGENEGKYYFYKKCVDCGDEVEDTTPYDTVKEVEEAIEAKKAE